MAASAYVQMSSLATAVGLTGATGYGFAFLQPDDGVVYFRDDGTDPTGTQGVKLLSGERFPYTGDLSKVKVIAATTGGATKLNVYYIGNP